MMNLSTSFIKPFRPRPCQLPRLVRRHYPCNYYTVNELLDQKNTALTKIELKMKQNELDLCIARSLLVKTKYNIPFTKQDNEILDRQLLLHQKHREQDIAAEKEELIEKQREIVNNLSHVTHERSAASQQLENVERELEKKRNLEQLSHNSIEFLDRNFNKKIE